MNRTEKMREMRKQGKTCQEIGDAFGLSKQRVFVILNGLFRGFSETDCVYKGLRKWLNDNEVCVPELCRMLYGDYSGGGIHDKVCRRLKGQTELKKSQIDSFIKLTGLTYEELFT